MPDIPGLGKDLGALHGATIFAQRPGPSEHHNW